MTTSTSDNQKCDTRKRGNGEPLIAFRGVSKSFGTLDVLCNVDLELHPNQTTVIIGESGAGKSVVLKHIVRLLRPDRGSVHFEGRRIDNLRERELVDLRTRFGFLFQMGALFDSLTVGENVAFPIAEHTHRRPSDIDNIVAEKLTMVGLNGLQDKKPAQLSGGQRKRVALARAIALDPDVILYDEPTTGLDPIRADVINELIRKLQRELGVTSIVVTHDMASARKVGDRVVMLHEGRFIFDGTPAELETSAESHVQQFIQGRADDELLERLHLKGKS